LIAVVLPIPGGPEISRARNSDESSFLGSLVLALPPFSCDPLPFEELLQKKKKWEKKIFEIEIMRTELGGTGIINAAKEVSLTIQPASA